MDASEIVIVAMDASEIVKNLRGSAAEREVAYAELLRREAEHNAQGSIGATAFVDAAVACVSPLCEVLCKSIAEVAVKEYHRASQVLTALVDVDWMRVGGELLKEGNFCTALLSSDTALDVVKAKRPSALTLEDAMTIAWQYSPMFAFCAPPTGQTEALQIAGISLQDWLAQWFPTNFLLKIIDPDDDPQSDDSEPTRSVVLAPLLLELLKAPEKLPEFCLGALWLHADSAVVLV